MNFIIIEDTREQFPWKFHLYDACESQVKKKLDTGDYSILGLENVITIERKASSGELYNNLFKTSKRFNKEVKRMGVITHSFLICEFSKETLLRFPQDSGIPKRVWKKLWYNAKDMLKKLEEFNEKYGIEIVFCNNKEDSQDKAINILKEIYGKYR